MTESSRTSRPRILVTRAEDVTGERWDDYADCVERAGGDPLPFDVDDFEGVDGLPPHDGVLITAGIDVDPARYGEARSDRVQDVNPRRDEVEEALARSALQRDIPLLAICRGCQVFNVALGGSLLQHLEAREPHRARRGPDGESIESGWHDVEIAPDSLLSGITRQATVRVNSRHHQAVLRSGVAEGLAVTGVAPDGIVEAIEEPTRRWALGVQWHPERPEMTDEEAMRPASTRLFDAFVAACAAVREPSGA